MNADGSNVTNISNIHLKPLYSPSGNKIAYSKYYDVGLWIMDIDGNNHLQLTTSLNFSDFGTDAFSFTSDGQSIIVLENQITALLL